MDDVPQTREIRSHYWVGDTVYLRVQEQEIRGMIIMSSVCEAGVSHLVTWEDTASSSHYEIELSREPIPDWAR